MNRDKIIKCADKIFSAIKESDLTYAEVDHMLVTMRNTFAKVGAIRGIQDMIKNDKRN